MNGRRQEALFTATGAVNATFTTARSLELLCDTGVDADLYAARIWHAYTSDGDVSGLGTPMRSVSGDAAAWNAPGTGLVKERVDLFG